MSTAAPPEEPREVDEEARAFLAAIHEIHGSLATGVEHAALEPLRGVLVDAAEKHTAICRLVGLHEDGRQPDSVGRAIGRYRAAVCERVLRPVMDRFAELKPGAAVGATWQEARSRLAALVADVPETRTSVVEPLDLFDPVPGDTLADGLRKATVRWSRAAGRMVRRRETRAVRTVPLRALARWHVDARLPTRQADLVETLAVRAATPASLIHRAFFEWAPVVLTAEVATDDASLHRPTDAPDRTARADANPSFEAVRAAAEALQSALERAAQTVLDTAVEDVLLALGGAEDAFVEDVRRAGSVLAHERGDPEDRRNRAIRAVDRRLDLWSAWHARVRGSLQAISEILHFRLESNAVVAGVNGAAGDAARALTARFAATARSLRAVRSEVVAEFDALADDDLTGLQDVLRDISARVSEIVDQGLIEPFADTPPGDAVREAVDDRLAALFAAVGELPEEVVVQAPPVDGGPPDPSAGIERRRPRGMASESFDVLQLERLREAGETLAAELDQAATEAAEARSVIDYNLHAAIAEISPTEDAADVPVDDTESDDDGVVEPADPVANAREFGLSGLERAAEMLERHAAEADAAVRPFTDAAFQAISEGWSEIVSRFEVEDTVHERVRDVRFLLRARLRQTTVRVTGLARSAWKWGSTWAKKGWARAEELLRIGQFAVEGERMTGEDRRATLEALADARHLLTELPLVYRRLFGLQIVADRLALEGRSDELDLVRTYDATWREGLTDALIISGWAGGGTSSFFESTLEVVSEDGSDVLRLSFDERVTDESKLCAYLAGELGIAGEPADLDELADAVLACDHELPVVGLDRIEMLLLRTASDNGLLGPFLTFLSRTDARVLWIATINRAAWTYIEKVEATVAGLVRHLPLSPLSRNDLESVILGRHKRSGLQLVFDQHDTYSPIMHRRMRRAASEAERQALLREDFFDRLVRASGSSIVIALFYWLRAAYIGEDEHTLRVRHLVPLNFGYLNDLNAAHAFSLKAFLEHGTLTVMEHDRVLHATRDESRDLFASLVNLLLIERAQPAPTGAKRIAIPDDVPFRIRSLVLHPVLTMLRARNLTV